MGCLDFSFFVKRDFAGWANRVANLYCLNLQG